MSNHPLTQNRTSAAINLVGPLGVGLSLIAVASPKLNFLFWFGVVISLSGAVGTAWLFWEQIRGKSKSAILPVVGMIIYLIIPAGFTYGSLTNKITPAPQVLTAQIEKLKEIQSILGDKDEVAFGQWLDINRIEEITIAYLGARWSFFCSNRQ